MFKCQKCKQTTKPNEKLNKVVIATREKEYTNKFIDKNGREQVKITNGFEIVKEICVCKKCLEEKENEQ